MLTSEQIIILTLAATLLTQIIKVIMVWRKLEAVNKKVVSAVLFVIATALSIVWIKPVIVPEGGGDFLVIIGNIIVSAGSIFGLAKLAYEFLLGTVFDKLKINTAPIVERNLIKERYKQMNL